MTPLLIGVPLAVLVISALGWMVYMWDAHWNDPLDKREQREWGQPHTALWRNNESYK